VATVDWRGTRALGATSVPAGRQLARARCGRFIRADIARAKKIIPGYLSTQLKENSQ